MDNNIILSICISAYNRKDLVCENVRKLLRYRGKDLEIIVSDNASDDGTVDALKQIGDERLKVYRNEVNVGLRGNITRMIAYATGKYVMIIYDRDWVEPLDIRNFIKTYRNRECDVILAVGYPEDYFKKNKDSFDTRTFLYCLFGHPGNFIVRRNTYDELVSRARKTEIDAYTEEWMADMGHLRYALMLYAKRWGCYSKQIIRQPDPSTLPQIKQLRGKSSNERVFFSPDGIMWSFKRSLDNPYIKSYDRQMYIIGFYRESIYRCLSLYREYRKNPCMILRYNYEPEESVCWAKLAVNFYREALSVLRERGLYTYRLAISLGLITLQEYLRLYTGIVIKIKTRFFSM